MFIYYCFNKKWFENPGRDNLVSELFVRKPRLLGRLLVFMCFIVWVITLFCICVIEHLSMHWHMIPRLIDYSFTSMIFGWIPLFVRICCCYYCSWLVLGYGSILDRVVPDLSNWDLHCRLNHLLKPCPGLLPYRIDGPFVEVVPSHVVGTCDTPCIGKWCFMILCLMIVCSELIRSPSRIYLAPGVVIAP